MGIPIQVYDVKEHLSKSAQPRQMLTPSAHNIHILAIINPDFYIFEYQAIHTNLRIQGNFGNHGHHGNKKPDQNWQFQKNAHFEMISII